MSTTIPEGQDGMTMIDDPNKPTEKSVCSNEGLVSRKATEERKRLEGLPSHCLRDMARRYASTMPDSQAADLLFVIAGRLGN